MKWLITGGCGFIATSLIRKLVAKDNHAFRVLDNLSVGLREDLAKVIEYVEEDASSQIIEPRAGECQLIVGDIRDAEVVEDVVKGMDVIVHLAANTGVPASVDNPRLDMECNVTGTFNVLEGARKHGVKRFVFASSGAPAGEVEPPIHEELPPHPVSPYGASKLAGEGYCSAYFRTFGIDTVALRFGNVYGPGSKHKSSVVAKFIRLALDGQSVDVYGDGTQTRDFIYIEDLLDSIIKAGTKEGVGGETYQIATSKESTVNDIVELIKARLKSKTGIDMKVNYSEPRLGDVKRNYSDTRKAKEQLGWQATRDLSTGIDMTIDYFLEEQKQVQRN